VNRSTVPCLHLPEWLPQSIGMFLSRLRLQPQINKPADGFGAAGLVVLLGRPLVDGIPHRSS
jgi:hypothetical protein